MVRIGSLGHQGLIQQSMAKSLTYGFIFSLISMVIKQDRSAINTTQEINNSMTSDKAGNSHTRLTPYPSEK